jgi:hypothetical protein
MTDAEFGDLLDRLHAQIIRTRAAREQARETRLRARAARDAHTWVSQEWGRVCHVCNIRQAAGSYDDRAICAA